MLHAAVCVYSTTPPSVIGFVVVLTLNIERNNNNNNNNNKLQLGCHLVAVVILHVYRI